MKTLNYISYLLIPVMTVSIIIYALRKKIGIYENFLEGVKEGAMTTFKIFPNILSIMIAITVFRESGALEFFVKVIEPITNLLKIPKEVVPLGIMSSVSGGASLGLLADTLTTYGADTVIGKVASTILGSSETTLYVLAIYAAAVNAKNTRNALQIGIACDIIAICVATWLCI